MFVDAGDGLQHAPPVYTSKTKTKSKIENKNKAKQKKVKDTFMLADAARGRRCSMLPVTQKEQQQKQNKKLK